MAYELSGSKPGVISAGDWKHIGIYVVIAFISTVVGDIISNEWISELHQINPVLEYLEHGVTAAIFIIGVILKKWLQDNESYIKK